MSKEIHRNKKTIQEYKQMDLPFSFFPDKAFEHYSNTLEFFDAIPKYYYGKKNRKHDTYLDILDWSFNFKGKTKTVQIKPTRIKEAVWEKGKPVEFVEKEYYPGKVEEIVHDTLIKIASSGNGRYYDREVGLVFTIGQLQKELKTWGYKYSKNRIKMAIEILTGSKMIVEYNGVEHHTGILKEAFLPKREEWEKKGKEDKFCFVQFHRLITVSITNSTNRLLNYPLLMDHNYILSKWLHKKMSHNFTQASIRETYDILLSSIIRDSKILNNAKLAENAREVKLSLEELKAANWILTYEIDKKKDGRKVIDYKYIITPGKHWVTTVIKGNKQLQKYRNTNIEDKKRLRYIKNNLKKSDNFKSVGDVLNR